MQRQIDWKFISTTALTIAGLLAAIAIPFLIWKVDLQSKSVTVKSLSVVGLMPIKPAIDGITLSVGGEVVDSVFVSTLSLSNDGSKPIPAADFESEISIFAGEKSQIMRVQVDNKIPDNLPVSVKSEKSKISLAPMLLNPGDVFKLVVISSGDKPTWRPAARIAGINELKLDESEQSATPVRRIIFSAIISGFAFIVYAYHVWGIAYRRAKQITFPWRICTAFVCLWLCFDHLKIISKELGYPITSISLNTLLSLTAICALLAIVAAYFRWRLLRRRYTNSVVEPFVR